MFSFFVHLSYQSQNELQMLTQETQSTKKYRSVKLTPLELSKLKKAVSKFHNRQEAADAIGIKHRETLDLVISRKSGSSTTINMIKNYLFRQEFQ